MAGPLGSRLVSAAVMVSCFAAANGFIFTGARACFAMSRSGSFFRSFGRFGPGGAPRTATLAQGVRAAKIALTGATTSCAPM